MRVSPFQTLLNLVFTQEQNDLQAQLDPLYQELEHALQTAQPDRKSQEEVSFRFERLRLGVAIALLQLLTDLGGDEESAQVRDLMQEALQATSIAGIDKVVQHKSHLFEELYTDLYVNHDAEYILSLFEATLNASTKEETDEIIEKALEVAEDLEFQADEDDQPEA
ncbi:hypothetical protein TH63_11505 [Rufibacter radiotolerans]|uniref:Uncharacterized protein n=1 Tax=Rufibacter radiotolerans TaxID=1379910 RepID=A0A0H4VJZ9_9BACT|nr:hypothetical protein [Rufibacter radiotolerans]AKQ46115.1 hypothetical protein TH63_11505 [Rufibacter radiotolerans]